MKEKLVKLFKNKKAVIIMSACLAVVLTTVILLCCLLPKNNQEEDNSNKITVNFYVEETLYNTKAINSLADYVAPTNPTKTGYTFDGWYLDNNTFVVACSQEAMQENMVENTVNLYAKFNINQYTVSFYVDDELYYTENVNYGESLDNIPEVPPREHYLSSWSVTDFTEITENMTVNAIYEAETFTYNEYPDSIEITGLVNKNSTSVVIPKTIKGKPVTVIADNAFDNSYGDYENLTTITFETNSNLETIGSYAFFYSNITSITLPQSVKNLEEAAFFSANFETVLFEEGFEIDTINKQTFYACSNLESITLPEGVKIIDDEAFKGCSSLETMILPDSVLYLGNMAFNICDNLQSIYIPNNLTYVGGSAFYYCDDLASVYYNGSVDDWDYITISAFNNDNFVNAARYFYTDSPTTESEYLWHYDNDEITVWEYFVKFYVDDSLYMTKGVNADGSLADIPEVPEQIGYTNGRWNRTNYTNITATTRVDAEYDIIVLDVKFYVGDELISTKQVNYGETLTDIPAAPTANPYVGTWDVTDFTNITENINVYAVKEILDIKFYVGTELVATKQVERGSTLTDIPAVPETTGYTGEWDRTDFTNLMTNINVYAEKVTLNVEFYVDDVLYTTKQVKYGEALIDIPSVPNKEGYTGSWETLNFKNITTNMVVNAVYDSDWLFTENESNIVITGIKNNNQANLTIPATINGKHVTEISENSFLNCGIIKTIIIPNSVALIGKSAFNGCINLTNITIPNSVASIGENAFSYCIGLNTVIFEYDSQLVELGAATFYKCSNLENINLPEGITVIKSSTFYECSKLTNITIPNSVEKIDVHAFSASGITSIKIPNNVTIIEQHAFYDCSSLQAVTFNSNSKIKTIGLESFKNCISLNGITIPNSVTRIYYNAFENCSTLETVLFEDNIQLATIEHDTFKGCSSLKNIVLPNTITQIESYAFYACSSLENIDIPSSVEAIGNDTFNGCSSLKNIVIPDKIARLSCNVFYNCSSLENVTLGEKVWVFTSNCFGNCSKLEEIIFNGSTEKYYNWVFFKNWAYKTAGSTITFHMTDGDIEVAVYPDPNN